MATIVETSVSVRVHAFEWELPVSGSAVVWYHVEDAQKVFSGLLRAGCVITGGDFNDSWSRLDVDLPDLRSCLFRLIDVFGAITVDLFSDDEICIGYFRTARSGSSFQLEEINEDSGFLFLAESATDAALMFSIIAQARLAYERQRSSDSRSTKGE